MRVYDELLERAKWGKLTGQELASVADALREGSPEADRYTLLHILGRAGALSYRPLVERHLHSPDDPMLARLALQILLRYWNEAARYQDRLLAFVRGVDWDEEEDVRLAAISLAGEYLRDAENPQLLAELVGILEDRAERQVVREAAYLALPVAAGRTPDELPSAARHFDLSTQTDPGVLEEARRRLLAYTA